MEIIVVKHYKEDKNFKTKMKATHIPYPALHNIIRGTEQDKARFFIRVYLYNLFMVQKKLYMNKALGVPVSTINNNSAVAHKTVYNKYHRGFLEDDYEFRAQGDGKDGRTKFQVLEFKKLEDGSKLLLASPKGIETSLNTFVFNRINPAKNKEKIAIEDQEYIDHAKKYFKGKLIVSGNFQKIIWQRSVTTKELRVLLALMRKVCNQKKVPALDLKYFEKFTGMRGSLIRQTLTKLKDKGLVHCSKIDNLRRGQLVVMFVSMELDPTQEAHIDEYVATPELIVDDIIEVSPIEDEYEEPVEEYQIDYQDEPDLNQFEGII